MKSVRSANQSWKYQRLIPSGCLDKEKLVGSFQFLCCKIFKNISKHLFLSRLENFAVRGIRLGLSNKENTVQN